MGGVHRHQRHVAAYRHVLVRIHVAGRRYLQFQFLTRHHAVIVQAFLFPLFLLLLPGLQLFLGVFHAFLIRGLGNELERVYLLAQHAHGVGDVVHHLHPQRVLVHEGGVEKPIHYGIAPFRRLHEEGVVGVEVKSCYPWQRVVAVAVEQREMVGVGAVALHEIPVGQDLVEGAQADVIGKEVGVARHVDGGYVQRVGPDGVLPRVGLERRLHDVVVESQHLALLVEHVVAIGVLQGIHAVFARRNALYGEVSARVGSRHPHHRLLLECRVAEVVVESHQDAFHGFQVFCPDYISRHLQGVDMVARGEGVSVVAERVSLVVVAYGVGEVDGVSGVWLQRVYKLHAYALALALYLWSLELRWRHHHVFRGVVYLYILIKIDEHLFLLHVCRPFGGIGANDPWRCLVEPSAVGVSHARATLQEQKHEKARNRQRSHEHRRPALVYVSFVDNHKTSVKVYFCL